MADYDEPDTEGVRNHIINALETEPLIGFEVVQYRHSDYSTQAFALVRIDGTVWIVSVQPGKVVLR